VDYSAGFGIQLKVNDPLLVASELSLVYGADYGEAVIVFLGYVEQSFKESPGIIDILLVAENLGKNIVIERRDIFVCHRKPPPYNCAGMHRTLKFPNFFQNFPKKSKCHASSCRIRAVTTGYRTEGGT
jgi:hypothetical protein